MPSKKILDELHKIAQSNSTEKISYNDFKRDLLNSLKVKNDECDEYLKIILNKARVDGNSLGEYNNGTFIISGSIIKIAQEEVSKKRKFIPGTEEFKKRMEDEEKYKGIKDSVLIENLLKDYSKLNLEEKLMLIGMTEKMDKAQFAEYKKGILRDLQDAYEKNIINEEKKAEVEESVFIQEIINENDPEQKGLLCVIHRANNGSKEDIEKINQLRSAEGLTPKMKKMIETMYKQPEKVASEFENLEDASKHNMKLEDFHLEDEIDPQIILTYQKSSEENISKFTREISEDLNKGNIVAAEEKAKKLKEDGFDEVYKVFEESQEGYLYMSFMERFIETETKKEYFSVDSDTIDLLEESYGKFGSNISQVNPTDSEKNEVHKIKTNEDSELSELSMFAEGLEELSDVFDQPMQDFAFEASEIYESEAAILDTSAVQMFDYSEPEIPENKETAKSEITIVDLDAGEAEKVSEPPRIPSSSVKGFTKNILNASKLAQKNKELKVILLGKDNRINEISDIA